MNRSNGLPDVRRRLGVLVGGKKLVIEIPNWVKTEMKSGGGEEEGREALRLIYNRVLVLEVMIKAFISTVKKEAQMRGMHVSTYRTCCHGRRCGTCRGIYKAHWPKWQIYANGVQTQIKTNEERDFFRQFGVSDKAIDEFYLVVELREIMLGIYDYTEAWWEKLGLKEVKNESEQPDGI